MLIINAPLSILTVIILGCITLCLLLFYFAIYGRFAFRKEKKLVPLEDLPPVSVVLTARDESHFLLKSLPVLLSQDYPQYEVVLVNDNSIDETSQIVIEFKNLYPHLHYVNLTSSISNIRGKKFPLALGIKAAKNEIVILTDASCIPSSPYWLQHIAGRFIRKTAVVLGGVTIARAKGFSNAFLRFDALQNTLQAFAFTLAGLPVMANGRNLAYTRSLFLNHKERFMAQPRMPYGDDDIFLNQVAPAAHCNVEPDPDAFVIQKNLSFSRWLRQKKIAFVTRSSYNFFSRFLLKSYNFLSLLFYVSLIFAILATLYQPLLLSITAGIAIIKIVSQYIVFGRAAKKINANTLTPFVLWFDILFAVFNPFINLLSKFEKRKWK